MISQYCFRFAAIFLFVASFFSKNCTAAELTGRVVGITDGDTITVLDAANTQHKVRLAAIDAPESRQPFGAKAKQTLSDLVYGKQVTVDWEKRDRYDRMVGKVLLSCPDYANCVTTDAGLQQVRDGMAWHFKKYAREQSPEDRARYATAENKAREGQLGLWADPGPMAPWDWRKYK